jgi:hypothetical protein
MITSRPKKPPFELITGVALRKTQQRRSELGKAKGNPMPDK